MTVENKEKKASEKAEEKKEEKKEASAKSEEQKKKEDSKEVVEEDLDGEEFESALFEGWKEHARAVDFNVSALESEIQQPSAGIRLEQALAAVPINNSLNDKNYVSSTSYESAKSYESSSSYSAVPEGRMPAMNQGESDFFRTPTLTVQPQRNPEQNNNQAFNNRNQEDQQREAEARKNRRF